MGSTHRNTSAHLKKLIKVAPQTRFFRLVNLFDRFLGGAEIGGEGPPRDERIRFRHDPSLAFASGDVSNVTLTADGERIDITTAFLGLTGSSSPLPLFMAEEVELEDEEHPVQRDFLDIFHHRLVSLFYRAVVHYRPAITHASNEDDLWLVRMLSYSALQFGKTRAYPHLPAGRLVRLIPLLSRRGRGAYTLRAALQVMLAGHVGDATVEVIELAGTWSDIDDARLVRLGERNHQLGHLMLGRMAPDPGGRFRIRVGPLGPNERAGFRRGEAALRIVNETVRLVLRAPLAYDLELDLRPEAVEPMKLGIRANLGRDSRLLGRPGKKARVLLRDAGTAA